jgi:hypothetical protein
MNDCFATCSCKQKFTERDKADEQTSYLAGKSFLVCFFALPFGVKGSPMRCRYGRPIEVFGALSYTNSLGVNVERDRFKTSYFCAMVRRVSSTGIRRRMADTMLC